MGTELPLAIYSLAFMVISIPLQKLVSNCKQGLPFRCSAASAMTLTEFAIGYFRLTVLIGSLKGTPCGTHWSGSPWLGADDAFPLILGEKWLPLAILPLQIMCLAGVFMMLGGTFDALFNALGRPDILFRYYLACALVFPPCFYFAGGRYGVIGIALVWSVVCPLMVFSLIALTRPITRFGLGDLLRGQLPIWAANLFMVVIVLGVQSGLKGPDLVLPRLVMSIVAGIAAYALAITALAWDSVVGNMKLLITEYIGS